MNTVELHCHTIFSNNRGRFECLTTPRALLRMAQRRGLSAVAITDHNTLRGNQEAAEMAGEYGVVVIPAVELDTNTKGQILAYGISEMIEIHRSPIEMIGDIHKQGGVAIIPHPFDPVRGMPSIDEVMKYADGIEVMNYGSVNNRKAKRFARQQGIRVQTGGSDAHHVRLVGTVEMQFPEQAQTVTEYLRALKLGTVKILPTRRHQTALVMGGLNIVYTRVMRFWPKWLYRREVRLAWRDVKGMLG